MAKAKVKRAVCAVCDIACQLDLHVTDGAVTDVQPNSNPVLKDNFCFKGLRALEIYNSKERLLKPLKRVGERGEGKWEEVSWDEALDDIAYRLKSIIDRYGPESFAVSSSGWNIGVDNGMCRRFMNLVGSPNYTSGVAYCMGNTAAVNKITLGWYPWPDFVNTDLVVLNGHNPRRHSWTPIYNFVRQAQARGAKLIVLDPRVSGQAERADLHLQLRSGTDSAMYLGWLNVIIAERLYDEEFVRDWTVGFDALKERVNQYPLERVEAITGVPASQIAEAARMYAAAKSACIPWSPVTDQQVSSTSSLRLQGIIKAICGHLDVPGGELMYGFNPDYIPESVIELHEAISPAQKAKQLGYTNHPAFTYRVGEKLAEHTQRVYGHPYANITMGCYMANPTELFRAMADEKPYPVKAFFSLGNNTMMSFANQPQIKRAIMNQELVVTHELFMTPTANLADYVLPGDTWLERPNIHDSWNWRSWLVTSEKGMEPPEECKSVFYFWKELAGRFGLGEYFPWRSIEELLDYRLKPLGMSFEQFCATHDMKIHPKEYRSYRQKGFATPSGKVELYSSILDDLGFDPLPYHRELARDESFPFNVFIGVREEPYFMTGQRHVPSLRNMSPIPKIFIHPDDADTYQLDNGDWAEVTSKNGSVSAVIEIRKDMMSGHLRIPRGWWFPELTDVIDGAGAHQHNDAVLIADDDEYLDYEQGVPQLKGFPGAIRKLPSAPDHLSQLNNYKKKRSGVE